MSVKSVILKPDVYLACLSHALSTESEEIMGVLIGYHDDENSVCHICAVFMLARSDRRPDRVEIPFVQLTQASEYAEKLKESIGGNKEVRVVGWYHSHPHITVWPSEVDLRTQADYQMMDDNFIGLIFSCFAESAVDADMRVEHICFRAVNRAGGGYERRCLPLLVENNTLSDEECLRAFVKIPDIFRMEEEEEFRKSSVDEEGGSVYIKLHNQFVYGTRLLALVENISSSILHCLEEAVSNKEKRSNYVATLLEKQKTNNSSP